MTKSEKIVTGRKPKRDKFAEDDAIPGEYAKPGPDVDSDFRGIALGLSKLGGRDTTGLVLSWLPPWAKRAKLPAFGAFFMVDRLAVDLFNRNRREMSALEDDLTQVQKEEIAGKTALCQKFGIKYLHLGPDDELDIVQLAAKIGKTTFKRPQEGDES